MGIISALGKNPRTIEECIAKGGVSFQQRGANAVCPIQDFNLKEHTGRLKEARYLHRGAAFAVAAASEAIKDSGLDNLADCGLFVGGGPNFDLGGELPQIHDGVIDEEQLAALWILKFLPNTAAAVIAKRWGIHGENLTVGTACAASLSAIGEAYRRIRDGYLNRALAGGGDSRLSSGGLLAYSRAGALWSGDDPDSYAPFSQERCGFIPGEGGACFMLEEFTAAKSRGATILAEICGFGSSMDGFNLTAPDPQGRYAEKAVRLAIEQAGLTPDEIELVAAHGTGTELNDAMEAELIERVCPQAKVTALKSWTGHLAAACGAMELGLILSCHEIPGIRKQQSAGPATNILLQNFGFGGQNAALVVKRC